ncbi:MAG TPA: GNAT family N-acetyltransferase [Thermoanaerobaculia bacterium]
MIRTAKLSEAAPLAELAERTFRDAFAAQNTAEDMDAYIARTYGVEHQRRELQDPKITTFVVENDGALIAFAQIKHSESDVELARIYVDRNFHGKGIAQDLMQAVFDVARNANVQSVWLGVWEHNPRAIAFYEKCGFRITGKHPFLLGSDLQTDLVMTRDL